MRPAFALILALSARAALADPATRGPHPIAELDAGRLTLAGAQIPVRVYHPSDTSAPAPLVLVVHGFLRNGSYMAEMARTFASRGFVAVVPDMPCGLGGCDHAANGDQLHALLAWATSDPSVASRVDARRRAIVGHSWGGLATFVAAARGGFEAAVLLDPNDDRDLARGMGASAQMPIAVLRAESIGNCNRMWTSDVFAAQTQPKLDLRVTRSAHCDAEEPRDGLCPVACGRGDPARSVVFRRYAVAFVACALAADRAVAPWIEGAARDAEVAAGEIDQVVGAGLSGLACFSAPSAEDAGAPDASAPADDASIAAADAEISSRDASDEDAATSLPDASDEDAATPSADASAGEDAASNGRGDAGVSGGDALPSVVADGCRSVGGQASWPLWVFGLAWALSARRRHA